MRKLFPAIAWIVPAAWLAAAAIALGSPARAQAVIDEARQAGRAAQTFPAADEDYFHDMDGGLQLTPDEVRGRNMWLVWTGGNDRLWDKLTNLTFGAFDLLKILSSSPGLKYSRDNRWNYFGLVNEPCFTKATSPDPQHYGLWLDQRSPNCPPDPFANAAKFPGVAVGARGKNIPAGSYYGEPTGVVGLRLFPNPAFDEAAAKRWDPRRFYDDPNYYLSKDLVRPYRVGMSCGFCHVSANPEKPPVNDEAPQWGNLSSTAGAQYFWVDRILAWNGDQSNFLFQVLHTARPGSLDTSLVSTDNINNPRTMNAVYNLLPRLLMAKRLGQETLGSDNLANKQFNDFVKSGPLTQFFQPPDTVWTPHVLKDGSDSVGALGALNRVYLNIGLFSEEWLRHFNPVLGGKPITPIQITTARANSSYWQATEATTPDMALFLLKASYPHKLKNAPGGSAYLDDPPATVQQGKLVFADNCAACHSSKMPDPPASANLGASCIGPKYLECFNRYWAWTQTGDFHAKMRQIVQADDFLDGNYLSTDARVPVTLLQTNACSPLATNAIGGNIWDNFSSQSYKSLPSVGTITVYDPFTGKPQPYKMPAGGRGYTRVPSLISLWATAPYLLNNSVGKFEASSSVAARMVSFQDSITQMLWPDKRDKDPVLSDKIPGVIDRTTVTSWLRIPTGYLPDVIKRSQAVLKLAVPIFDEKGVEIGPIPKGTPVDLLANFSLLPPESSTLGARLAHDKAVVAAVFRLIRDLRALPKNATDDQARQVIANLGEQLFALSKCPDYVVNRGHYFGSKLSDPDKNALIAFLKTF
jgi:cytochrome c2